MLHRFLWKGNLNWKFQLLVNVFLNFRFFYTGFYCVILNRRTVTWNLFVKLIDITSEQIFNIIQVSWTSWFRKHDPNALLGVYYFIWLIWGCSTGQGIVVCPPLSKTASRVLPRIYQVGEKSWVAEGDEHPKGIRGLPPPPKIFGNEYALRCNLVHFKTQFWEMLQCVHQPCHVWMIFAT